MQYYFTSCFPLKAAYYKIYHIIMFGIRQGKTKKLTKKKVERNRDTRQQNELKRQRQQAHSKEERDTLAGLLAHLSSVS